MRIARIRHEGTEHYATVEDEDRFDLIEGGLFGPRRASGQSVPADRATLLAPVTPPQVIAIGLNYRAHATECGMDFPDEPVIFVKTCNTVTDPGRPILLPKIAPSEVDYEAEMVLVIGKEAKHVPEDQADAYILGYTCGNDVSARDCQIKKDKQWARGKSFDTFAPIGPWIATDLDGDNLDIRLELNGQAMQDSNTADLIFSCRHLVSFLSSCMTLYPGSIIMTGTPAGVGIGRQPPVFLKEGDVVTVEIEGIGRLTNPVEKER